MAQPSLISEYDPGWEGDILNAPKPIIDEPPLLGLKAKRGGINTQRLNFSLWSCLNRLLPCYQVVFYMVPLVVSFVSHPYVCFVPIIKWCFVKCVPHACCYFAINLIRRVVAHLVCCLGLVDLCFSSSSTYILSCMFSSYFCHY
jgi:hypothetical protein